MLVWYCVKRLVDVLRALFHFINLRSIIGQHWLDIVGNEHIMRSLQRPKDQSMHRVLTDILYIKKKKETESYIFKFYTDKWHNTNSITYLSLSTRSKAYISKTDNVMEA